IGGYGGDGGPATSALLRQPVALAFAYKADGTIDDTALYASELTGHRVRRIDLGAGTISTHVGTGIGCRLPTVPGALEALPLPTCSSTDEAVRSAIALALDPAG